MNAEGWKTAEEAETESLKLKEAKSKASHKQISKFLNHLERAQCLYMEKIFINKGKYFQKYKVTKTKSPISWKS